ncbi:ABC transporter permease subunit [Streptomyces sp. A7024]|uniref:ABC transporter permease subunit n=1 Tax=Streptomyces coryli TaxID=1128680 RepID=A0A6G4UBZ7_9ACTN|nr:ABC transporter permease subunit [Streptomyces coryli]NGN69663.1 ABC transporter permease subunit [Streptomyces coryli]
MTAQAFGRPASSVPPAPGGGPTWTTTAARLLHAEWTKLRTVPSTWWLLGTAVALMAAVGAGSVSAVSTDQCASAAACQEDTVKLSLTGIWLGMAVAAVLGALALSGEFGTGTIRATFTATPRRWRVLAAKAAVLSGVMAAVGAAAVSASLLIGRLVLPGNGFTAEAGYPPPSLGDGPTLRAAAGTVLVLVLVALLGLGLAALLRDTAGTLTATLGLLYLAPIFKTLISDERWAHRLERWAPMPAGLSIQSTRDLDRLAIAPWPGLGVLAAYAAGALLLGALALRIRDAAD